VDGRPGSDRPRHGLATPIVEKIVGAFSEPGGRVAAAALADNAADPGHRPRLTPVFSEGC